LTVDRVLKEKTLLPWQTINNVGCSIKVVHIFWSGVSKHTKIIWTLYWLHYILHQ